MRTTQLRRWWRRAGVSTVGPRAHLGPRLLERAQIMCKACKAGSYTARVMFAVLWGFCLFHINHSARPGTLCAQTVATFISLSLSLSLRTSLTDALFRKCLFVCARPPPICSAPDDSKKGKQFTALIKAFSAFNFKLRTRALTRTHTHKVVDLSNYSWGLLLTKFGFFIKANPSLFSRGLKVI